MADGSLHVLLISANTEQRPDPVFPIGAACIAAAAERAGHVVETFDCRFEPAPLEALARALAGRLPDVVAISLRNLDSSAYPQNTSYIDDYRQLVAAVRAAGVRHIVLGGAGFTIAPQALMAVLDADVGVVGEGELAFPWVLAHLATGAPLVSTAAFRCAPAGVGVCVTPTARLTALDACGTPLRERFDWRTYYARGGALNIQTKRGCAFECVFCSYPLIEGSKVRMRSAAAVVDEIAAARAAHDVRHWFFVDNIFNLPPRHAKAICAELIARRVDIEWSAYVSPGLEEELIDRIDAHARCRPNWIVPGLGIKTNVAVLRKLRDRHIKGQLWRLLR